ncbi:MAG: ABC transporter permease [Caldicoprobacterales bacterium]|jgi:ABC-2 type transport system permease protein
MSRSFTGRSFRGWTNVFGFTFRQNASKGYKAVTILVAMLIMGGLILAITLTAKPEEEQQASGLSPVKTLYVLDETGQEPVDFQQAAHNTGAIDLINIEFISKPGTGREELIKEAAAHSSETIALIISENSSGYRMEAAVPDNSGISEQQAQQLLDSLAAIYRTKLLVESGMSQEQLNLILTPTFVQISDIGGSMLAADMIKTLAPLVFGFMLYFMLLIYGQTVSKSVSIEKTSRLIETLLTSVHPNSLISGKILAAASLAIIQFASWIAAVFAGLYGGNAIAKSIYPEYENTVVAMLGILRDNIGQTALTAQSVLVALLFFFTGFLFYCVLAALAGSLVSKPEDVASTQVIFVMPIIISWLITFLATLSENNTVIEVSKYIPFTSPFLVPVHLLTGAAGLGEGILTLFILIVFTVLLIILSARIYKGLVLYMGQKLSLKTIGNVLKGNG